MVQISSDLLRSETVVHRPLKYMLNFSYWRSVGLKHTKCLAEEDSGGWPLFEFNANNASTLLCFYCQRSDNNTLISYVVFIFIYSSLLV